MQALVNFSVRARERWTRSNAGERRQSLYRTKASDVRECASSESSVYVNGGEGESEREKRGEKERLSA